MSKGHQLLIHPLLIVLVRSNYYKQMKVQVITAVWSLQQTKHTVIGKSSSSSATATSTEGLKKPNKLSFDLTSLLFRTHKTQR